MHNWFNCFAVNSRFDPVIINLVIIDWVVMFCCCFVVTFNKPKNKPTKSKFDLNDFRLRFKCFAFASFENAFAKKKADVPMEHYPQPFLWHSCLSYFMCTRVFFLLFFSKKCARQGLCLVWYHMAMYIHGFYQYIKFNSYNKKQVIWHFQFKQKKNHKLVIKPIYRFKVIVIHKKQEYN